MKLKNRFIRMAAAFAIVGVVASQIPSRPSVSLAADGYKDGGGGLLQFKGTTGAVTGAVLAGAAYSALANAGALAAGGTIQGAVLSQSKPIYDVTASKPNEFSLIKEIIDNANNNQIENYRLNGQYTVFWPLTSSFVRDKGATNAYAFTKTGAKADALGLLQSLTVSGAYNLKTLKGKVGQNLTTLAGTTITVGQTTAGKLTLNGVVVVETEYPASNGWVLATDGVVPTEE